MLKLRIVILLLIPVLFISCSAVSNNYKAPRVNNNVLLTSPSNELSFAPSKSLGDASMPLAIINPRGSALTVWALAEGNWIWGYTLDRSRDFGGTRLWQVINLGGDIALIRNVRTGNCLHDEGRGVTHRTCNRNNKNQQWELLPMDNGAVMIVSVASKNCLRTEYGDIVQVDSTFSITMEKCTLDPNLDQQWIFIPAPIEASPLLGDK
ncbi:RICIN domain-containing protein [Campylobacter mucosalis]|uniref:RICIN domain-containing protein n=1 Tax=Campylobacter mucosalis TaxID=202 RepID=UPI00146FC9A3|nr:RICIN domain-containing protein [Campylobacter mucosalis]